MDKRGQIVILVTALLCLVTGCATQPEKNVETVIVPITVTSNELDICEWFNKSQVIRTKRIPAILKVQEVADKYSATPFDFSNTAMINEYKNALRGYVAAQDEFIEDWNKMGVYPSAKVYWENELRAVELFKEDYLLSLKGFEQQDGNKIQEGADIYQSGNIASSKAESEMITIRQECMGRGSGSISGNESGSGSSSSIEGCPNGCQNHRSGCDIKGNISVESGEKIYHVPGQEYYDETKISSQYGELWFCTEAEARANGWRKAKK